MENQTLAKGNRIKVGRHYGVVGLVTPNTVWYHADEGGYRFAKRDAVERVHGNTRR
jgi:hypothetical protein